MKGVWDFDDRNNFAYSVGGLWWTACLHLDLYWHFVFCLAFVPQGKRMGSMSDMNVLIEQMVTEISTQTFQLEDRRLRLFLNWLMEHSIEMKVSLGTFDTGLKDTDIQERFRSALKTWLQSLPAQGLLWEYQTITGEIGWWRDLDPSRWKLIIKTEEEP
ncbi:MAG: hypothetical protein DPW18_00115 [Chloroflexi bacterium]|jgi:hypothetical protein|nr:hypothetical protein [Chloroflexota bacterium]